MALQLLIDWFVFFKHLITGAHHLLFNILNPPIMQVRFRHKQHKIDRLPELGKLLVLHVQYRRWIPLSAVHIISTNDGYGSIPKVQKGESIPGG